VVSVQSCGQDHRPARKGRELAEYCGQGAMWARERRPRRDKRVKTANEPRSPPASPPARACGDCGRVAGTRTRAEAEKARAARGVANERREENIG
jgi:hypothetical protein